MVLASIQAYEPGNSLPFAQAKRVVLVGGCFDILHYGHFEFLEQAKKQGDHLVVALEPNETISGRKCKKAFHTQEQRAKNLSCIRFVDDVLLLPVLVGFSGYRQLCIDIHPHVIAITAGDPEIPNKTLHAEHIGAELIVVTDLQKGVSSTQIQANTPLCSKNALRAYFN